MTAGTSWMTTGYARICVLIRPDGYIGAIVAADDGYEGRPHALFSGNFLRLPRDGTGHGMHASYLIFHMINHTLLKDSGRESIRHG